MLIKTVLVTCTFLLQGCAFSGETATCVTRNMKQVRHLNGLTVGVPQGFAAKETDAGFIIEPEGNKNASLRRPIAVRVELAKDFSQDAPFESKDVNGKQVLYRIEKNDGGSGGEQYYLEVYEKVKDGYISFSQSEQSEYSEPDFKLCWQIVEFANFKL